MITSAKVKSAGSYFLVIYVLDGHTRQLDRPFRDKKDAKRVAKSLVDSQSFNLTTTGGK